MAMPIESLFIQGPVPPNALQGSYEPMLVLLSYVIAFCGSFVGLSLASDIFRAASPAEKNMRHLSGAFALGAGIWSMHFIGMLAFQTDMVHTYDPLLTFLSMVIAVASAWAALWMTRQSSFNLLPLIGGAILLGGAIFSMHYLGMSAMRMDAALYYKPLLFALSIAIAINASGAALAIIFYLARYEGSFKGPLKMTAALILALAICGMHYTGMFASVIVPYANCRFDPNQSFDVLVVAITCVTALILGVYLFQSKSAPSRF